MGHIIRFDDLQSIWMEVVFDPISKWESIRKLSSEQLVNYFSTLCSALNDKNSNKFYPLIEQWIDTEDEDESQYYPSIFFDLFEYTCQVCLSNMTAADAIKTIQEITPILTQITVYAAVQDKQKSIKKLTAQMEKMRSDLETLDKSKSAFISVAAHELKTPLTLIDGYLSMFTDAYASDPDLVYIKYLIDGMGVGAERLKQIVEDMIDVSLIDNNLLSLNFQPVWINRLLDIVRSEFIEHISERQQILTIMNFDGSNEMIFADPERILQAFRNLLSNAVKYTPDQGEIIINGRMLPGFVEITFKDSGIGIAFDDQDRIFEKFYRMGNPLLHSSGKIKYKGGGPGLGLPITKGIIEAHGGALWVESEGYDEVKLPGSTFHVLIPARTKPPNDRLEELFRDSSGDQDF